MKTIDHTVCHKRVVATDDCTLKLVPQGDGGKVDITFQCASCQSMNTLDIDNCDIYMDLGIATSKLKWLIS